MNQATLTTVIGAVTAALLAGSQVMTHDKINMVTDNTVPKSVVQVNQQRHDDEIAAIQGRVTLLEQLHVVDKGHMHQGEVIP